MGTNIVLFLIVMFGPVTGFSQCNSLRKTTDKFTGEIRISTDLTEPAVLIRSIQAGITTYFLTLTAPASANADRQGVNLLFDNGTRLDWPAESVTVSYSSYHPRWDSHFTARSFIQLTDEQVQTFAKQRVTDYRLYVFDWTLKERFGESLQKQIGCLVNANPETVRGR